MDPNSTRRRPRSLVALLLTLLTILSIWQPSAATASETALETPPTLLNATRVSGDTLVDGDRVEIAWEFDAPVESVAFLLRDAGGREHQVQWNSWAEFPGEPAASGTAVMNLTTPAWAGGDVAFDALQYGWAGGSVMVDASGSVVWTYPEGLADPTLPEGGLGHLGFTVSSDYDPAATPKLTSFIRTSADVVRDGDEIVLDWTADGAVDSVNVVLRDALGGTLHLFPSSWGAAASGQVRTFVDALEWPAGTVELEHIEYSWAGGGDVWSTIAVDANGEVLWSWGIPGEAPSSVGAIAYTPFEIDSDLDLTVPATLTSAERVSAEVLAEGEELRVAWSFDRPVDSVQMMFRDARGMDHFAEWSVWEAGSAASTEGIADAVIDTTRWAAGEVTFAGIRYDWGAASMLFDASGRLLSKTPPGLQDATFPLDDLAGLTFTIESDVDLAAVPSITAVSRLSGETLHDGEDAAIAWEFDRPVHWVSFQYVDGLGRGQSVMWSGEAATSGVASMLFQDTPSRWAPGAAELVDVRYAAPGDNSVVLARDGSVVSTWPDGLAPTPFEPGFAALDFHVETDAVFETVDVPAPVFTDATCDAPAHLFLEDFPNGWWTWTPGGSGYGGSGEAYDAEPWLPFGDDVFTVIAHFDDGWGTTGETRWTHRFTDPGSCEPLLELTSTPTPTIEGDPVIGSSLTAAPGAWEPAPVDLAFQWLRDGDPIEGATEPRYVPTSGDVDARISVEVTGSKDGYESVTRAGSPVLIAEPGPAVTRVDGDGRFGLLAAASVSRWAPGVEVAYVANASDEVSSITGAALAAASDSPLLSVKAGSIPDETAGELQRLAPERIVVLGGADLVTDAVVEALGEHTDGSVERVSGDGPFGLAAAISAHRSEPGVGTAYVLNASDAGAAYAGAALAGATDSPLVLTEANGLPAESSAELRRLAPERVVVLGNSESVTEAVLDELRAVTGVDVERVATGGRFTASADVAASGWPTGAGVVYVVNGADKAAATAGAVLAGAADGPLLTVKKASIPAETAAEIRRLDPRRIVVLGDAGAVDGTVFAELEALVG